MQFPLRGGMFLRLANLYGPDSHSFADDGRAKSGQPWGVAVNYQTLELSLWLGIAVFALIWAGLSLWRARRLLNQLHQGVRVSQGRLVASALADETGLVRAP